MKIVKTNDGSSFEVEILDGTHLKFRLVGTERWATALHFGQLNAEWVTELSKLGLVAPSGRHFLEEK